MRRALDGLDLRDEAPYAETRRTYDRVAIRYRDRLSDRSPVLRWLDALAARLEPGALVLDIGCGPGFDSTLLRERGLRAIGLDFSAGMLRSGRMDYPGPRVQADMRALPLQSASADAVWANASLLHVGHEDVPRALAEFSRVLVPGGALHLAVKRGEGGRWENSRYEPDEPRWFTYWSPEELDRCLERAGFALEQSWTDPTPRDTWLIRHARAG